MAESTKTRKAAVATTLEVPYPSKATLPARRPAIIRRQRLIEALSKALDYRITLVSAPAGYGKTTLLLDFAQSAEYPVAWYALDERDRDLDTFLRYFTAAGRHQFPDFGASIVEGLAAGDEISPERATDLLVEATNDPSQPFLILLDDFHFLDAATPELKQALEGWLYRLPPDCHVILSGRTQCQLGVLPLMSVRQEVTTISSVDFSFSCEEVIQLYRDVLGKAVTPDDAQHLANITEGWAGALVLMADRVEASRTMISLEHLRRSDTLAQYITLEQFDPLPANVKDFLLASAVPRTMEIETVNELLDTEDTEETLNFLERRNLFVVRNEENAAHYRYHRLFRAYLVSHLRADDPQRFRNGNLKAAALREKREEWEEAVYHYIQAGAWDEIVKITDQLGPRLFEEGRWDTLSEWLEGVPEEALLEYPRLMLWKARILTYLNQVDSALAVLSQAIAAFESGDEWAPLAEGLVIKGMCLRVKGAHDEAKEALNLAIGILEEQSGCAPALAEARLELGRTYSVSGEHDQAQVALKAVLEVYEAGGDIYNIAYVSDQLGIVLALLGRISDAAIHFERARQCWTKVGNNDRLLLTANNLGVLYYLQGDFDQADSVLSDGLDRAAGMTNSRPELYLRVSLADIKRDRGDHAPGLEEYRSALEMARKTDEAAISIYISDAIANTYRLMGDSSNCEAWAQRASAEADERGGMLEMGLCATTLGLIQRDRDRLKEAAASLERACGLLNDSEAKRELATAYFHLAGVYFAQKRKTQSLECLDTVARLVKELGYDHFLTLEAGRNPALIQYASANKLADGYFERMLKTSKSSRIVAVAVEDEGETAETDGAIKAFGFGNLRVEAGGREISDLEWRSEKGKEMFFFFLCNRRPLRKEEILTALWPDLDEDKTTSAFHSNMYRLRKALYSECIAKESGRYVLDTRGQFVFDVEQFQQLLAKADAKPKGSPEALAFREKALGLYGGQFAADFYSEWAETLRWQLEEQFTGLLASLAAGYNEGRDYKRSIEICQRILELDEFNEAAWYRLLANYIQSDQMEAARYAYNRYSQIIAKDGGSAEDIPDFDSLCREIAGTRRTA